MTYPQIETATFSDPHVWTWRGRDIETMLADELRAVVRQMMRDERQRVRDAGTAEMRARLAHMRGEAA